MNYPWQATVQDDQGNAVVNPVVTVWEADGITLATIYDVTGAEIANPITGSLEGFVQFWAAEGEYRIEGASGGEETAVWSWIAGVPSVAQFTTVQAGSVEIPAAVVMLETVGYSTIGDGGGASYYRVSSEPAHDGKIQTADGSWWELHTTEANIMQFGADRSASDHNSAIQAAWRYSKEKGVSIYVPSGTWVISQPILVYTHMVLRGEGGAGSSIITLADDSNCHMLLGETTEVNWALNPWADGEYEGDNLWEIKDILFDGNRDNQTFGSGLRVWGRRWNLINVSFLNIRDSGMSTRFNDGTTPLGMEARIDNVIIDRCGADGWYFAGPHDSTITGLIVIDAGLNEHNTYCGLRTVSGGNGRFFGFHAWSRGWNSSRMRSAFSQESGGGACSFDNSHFEGAYYANVDLNGFPCQFGPTCMFYASWNGANVILGTGGHTLMGVLDGPGSGRPDCYGINLGWDDAHRSGGNLINIRASNQRLGIINFGYTSGGNIITAAGYNSSGTPATGAPATTDIINIAITGGGGGRIYANPTW